MYLSIVNSKRTMYAACLLTAASLMSGRCLAEGVTIRKAQVMSRVAFFVANDQYVQPDSLATPTNDACELAPLLREHCYFDVRPAILNQPASQLKRSVTEVFAAHGTVDVVFFYYSGHGYQTGGQNYLRSIKDGEDLSLDAVVKTLNMLRPRLLIVLLDCCSSRPAQAQPGLKGGHLERPPAGLATYVPPLRLEDTSDGLESGAVIVSYAAAPNKSAWDKDRDDKSHSPYARALIDSLNVPLLTIGQMLTHVENQVKERTGGAQEPWVDFRGPENLRRLTLVHTVLPKKAGDAQMRELPDDPKAVDKTLAEWEDNYLKIRQKLEKTP